MTQTKQQACLLCGSVEHTVFYEFSERNVVRCSGCGFVFVHPMPEDGHFQDIYAGDYWNSYQVSVGERDIHDRLDEFMEISRERIEYLSRFKTSGRFLDVGCSMGFLVKAAQDAGFDACGLDLSETTLAEGRRRYGVKLYRGPIEDSDLGSFDVIASYNTIEHVVRPDRFLVEMRKRLAPEGIVVIGTHDVDCQTHRREGRLWKHVMPAEHLYMFRREDLETLGRKSGLEPVWHNKPVDNLIVLYFRSK